MSTTLIKNANVVFNDSIEKLDVLIDSPFIKQIDTSIHQSAERIIDADGLYLFPGIIDTHVHFREPGLTHKADIRSESLAALAGGITSVIDMPNTIPFADNIGAIKQKKEIAKQASFVNIGFFVGANLQNVEALLSFPKHEVAGIKVFLGSSTGNVKLDDAEKLDLLFANSYLPIVVHAESEPIIQKNLKKFIERYGKEIPFEAHTEIRSTEACLESTSMAVGIARKYNTSLHILHVSTKEELDFINIDLYPNITAEVCIPHLWFTRSDFEKHKGFLKCNPSVKTDEDKESLRKSIKTSKIHTVGTDHAPHTYEEKQKSYIECPSGTTSIQHSLLSMIELSHQGYFNLPTIAQKMAYLPARKFNILNRGEIKAGNFADLVLVDLNSTTFVSKESVLYKCKWTVFEGFTFGASIVSTFINGQLAYQKGEFDEKPYSMLLEYRH